MRCFVCIALVMVVVAFIGSSLGTMASNWANSHVEYVTELQDNYYKQVISAAEEAGLNDDTSKD